MATHQLADITVVADAGMVSAANQNAIEDAGLTFIIGAKIPQIPYQVNKPHRRRPAPTRPTRSTRPHHPIRPCTLT